MEENRHACTTYLKNFQETGLIRDGLLEADILKLDPRELLAKASLDPGDCDLLLGGPPCQGFSTHRINGAGIGDPRNELLLRYIDFLRVIQPRMFLVENVPGILWPRHRAYLDSFYRLAQEAGYQICQPVTLNAKDYGVPQNRRRVFLLGYKGGSPPKWPPSPTHGPTLKAWLPAQVAFESPSLCGDPNDIHMKHGPELTKVFVSTPVNGGSRTQSTRQLPCHDGHSGHKDVYGRISPSQPGPTMTTACCNPSKGRFVHPTQPHGITLRQAARLQSFPEWFEFCGGLTASERQIGNAVPVEMARALLSSLITASRPARELALR